MKLASILIAVALLAEPVFAQDIDGPIIEVNVRRGDAQIEDFLLAMNPDMTFSEFVALNVSEHPWLASATPADYLPKGTTYKIRL